MTTAIQSQREEIKTEPEIKKIPSTSEILNLSPKKRLKGKETEKSK